MASFRLNPKNRRIGTSIVPPPTPKKPLKKPVIIPTKIALTKLNLFLVKLYNNSKGEKMEKFFIEAAKNFAKSIGAEIDHCEEKVREGFISEIDIRGDENLDIFLILPKDVLDIVSELLFGDIDYDVADLAKEIANLIVGNAKVLASEEDIHFNITTPKFHDNVDLSYDKRIDLSIKGKCFSILFKEV